jgi:hypothetical protein
VQAGRQLLEKSAELEVMAKTVAATEDDKDRLVAELKRREEEVFRLLDQGIAGVVHTFRSNSEYIETLVEFNIVAEFVGRTKGFVDRFQYASEGQPQSDYPYHDPEAANKRSLAQRAFENV